MIEIERSPADGPNGMPQRWQVDHEVSLKPSNSLKDPVQKLIPVNGIISSSCQNKTSFGSAATQAAEMPRDELAGGTEPNAVQLHLHRGIGWGIYGTATTVVLLLVLAGAATNVSNGRLLIAGVIVVVGLTLTAFLAFLTYSMVMPALTASATGISGRLSWRDRVDADWNSITIDFDDETSPGTMRLDIGEESVSVSGQSWVGFEEFISLLGSTPPAAARLTPAARREVTRLLQTGG
jgi:hypothetical protein